MMNGFNRIQMKGGAWQPFSRNHHAVRPFYQQGRIVHRSGLNNENDKNKNSLKSKIKDFKFNSTIVKADIF